MSESLNRLHAAVSAVEPQWQGAAKDRFIQEFREWELALRQFSQLLETAGTRLETLANDVADTDRSATRRIGRIGA
jgi:WXG100 family type VII secretion target